MELVGRFTGAEKYGLYLAETIDEGVPGKAARRVFRLGLQHGWTSPDEFATELDESHPAVERAVRTGEVVTVRDVAASDKDILACVALRDPSEARPLGLIHPAPVPFVRLTQMDADAPVHDRGLGQQDPGGPRRMGQAMKAASTTRPRARTTRCSWRSACPRSVPASGGTAGRAACCWSGSWTSRPWSRRTPPTCCGATGELLTKLLRTVDVVGTYRMPGVFALLLPETNTSQCVIVSARVNEAFRGAFGVGMARFDHLRLKMGLSMTREGTPLADNVMMDQAERFELRPDHTA